MSLKKNTLFNYILIISNFIFPFISAPYVSRVLQINDIGLINNGNVLATLVIKLCSLGFAAYSSREIARCRNEKTQLNKFFSLSFTSHLLATIIGLLIYYLYVICFINDTKSKLVYLIFGFQIIAESFRIDWLYSGLENFTYIAKRSIIIKFLSIIALFVFVHKTSDYYIYAVLLVTANIANCLFNILYSKKFVELKLSLKGFWGLVRNCKYFYFLTVIMICYQNINQLILGKNNTDLALYTRALSLGATISMLVTPIINTMAPRLSNIVQTDKQAYKEYVEKAYSFYLFLLLPSVTGLALLAREFMYLFGGEQFLQGDKTLAVIALYYGISTTSVFINELINIPNSFEKNTMYSNCFVALVALVANPFFILQFGSVGAALVSFLSECVGLFVQLILMVKRKLMIKIQLKHQLKYYICTVFMGIIIICVKYYCSNAYITILVAVPMAVIGYLCSQLLVSKLFNDEFIELKEILCILRKK